MIERRDQLTPREYETMQYERERWQEQAAHQLRLKEMEVQALRTEAKITSWFKIPLFIIKLPVLILFALPLTVYAITHQEVPEFYQRFFK